MLRKPNITTLMVIMQLDQTVLRLGARLTNTVAFFFMIMTVLSFLYVLAALRTNITLAVTFFFIDMAFFMLMSSYWVAAEGRAEAAKGLQIVSRTRDLLKI